MNSQLNQAGTSWLVTMRAGAQEEDFQVEGSVPSLTDVGSVHPSAPACKPTPHTTPIRHRRGSRGAELT
jgi:hypothetical protein